MRLRLLSLAMMRIERGHGITGGIGGKVGIVIVGVSITLFAAFIAHCA